MVEDFIMIRGGVIHLQNPQRFDEAVSSLPDGMYHIAIDMVFGDPSSRARGYYWKVIVKACVTGIEEQWGQLLSKDDAHVILKTLFLPNPPTTKKLSRREFWDYVERCRGFLSEFFGIDTPDPKRL